MTAFDPAAIIQQQLDAYNARDIDAFMAFWADDAEYYGHPSTLLAKGAAAIRARHVERFKETNLQARLVNRVVLAGKVVDQERVTRTFPEGPGQFDVVVIYELSDAKIAKAWFIMGEPVLDAA